MNAPPELLVVIPVFNEQAAVGIVIRGRIAALEQTVDSFVLLAINDGSTDSTLERIRELETEFPGKLEVLSRANKGHGRTCVEGYRIAIERDIAHVLQINSDGQSDPVFFPEFWQGGAGMISSTASERDRTVSGRIFASAVLRALLRFAAAVKCLDANVPTG